MNTTKQQNKRKKDPRKVIVDDFLALLRDKIRPDIKKFKLNKKTAQGYWISDYSGYRIKDNSKVEVDHVAKNGNSFRNTAYNWIKSINFDINTLDFLTKLELNELLSDWLEFHRKHCELQIVSRSQNKHLWWINRASDIHYSKFYLN